MRNTYRFREHHEKSIAVLDMIESCNARIKSDQDTYNHMLKMFGSWDSKYEMVARLAFRKEVLQRLTSYYHNLQEKHFAINELGQLMASKMEDAA
jgi:hypothetical protein